MTDSQQIVARVLAGEPEAFDAFYESYFQRVYCFAQRRSLSRADAEQRCTAIFEAVLGQLDRYDPRIGLDAWVLAIARRTIGCDPVETVSGARARSSQSRPGTATPRTR